MPQKKKKNLSAQEMFISNYPRLFLTIVNVISFHSVKHCVSHISYFSPTH